MSIIIDLLSWVSLVAGSIFLIIGTIGLIRLPDFFTRLHAASVVDTLGCILIMMGLMLQAGLSLVTVKLILIMIFILLTSPTAAHALAKAALHGEVKPLLHHSGE
ncbi:MAG: monovalent cation/H(+) antiporter subunit G [Proteobacteria bacterium]|nr:monovalent cation/H(+) antiporter subunit G [Pseudomonadota bacterium]MCH9049294.1 monovalent cation/H(+) antiporter subunit G [Pseudomonadota bacterium]